MEKRGFYAVGYWPVDDEKEASQFPAEFTRPRGSVGPTSIPSSAA